MLRAYALADLFESNCDKTVPYIFLGTTGGNLIGACPQMPASLVKRLSVLGALTWRFHAPSSLQEGINGNAPVADSHQQPGRPAALPVLKKGGGGSDEDTLRELVVECDSRVCAFEYVREGLLVGAVSEELTVRKEDGESVRRSGSVGESSEVDDATGSEDRDRADNDTTDETELLRRKERIARLLAVKASAMSDHLREELKDFRMPTGIE